MYAPIWNVSEDIENGFKSIAKDILNNGLVSKPRGKQTKQAIGATIILNPNDTMIRNKQRKMNYIFSLVEKLVYTSGNGLYSGILDWYNSNYSYYEDGVDIGNYCWRIMPQIRRTIDILKKDPDSRQAIISIYNNLFDQRPTIDVPCTLALQFLIRNNKLDMIVTMRSNDLLWGFSYDINQFAYIQKLFAMFLDIETGVYIHHSNSLHIYDYSYEQFDKIISCNEVVEQEDFVPIYIGTAEQKLNMYFKDIQKFWRHESLWRYTQLLTDEGSLNNFTNTDFNDKIGFFNYRLQKLFKYNLTRSNDHYNKYFKQV